MAVAMIGPKFYAWDRNGKPLAFGKLYTYQARTNAPKATYQSEDQIVENSNPVILNGEGYANIYLNGSYKMVLKDKDENEIWSADPVSAAEPSEWVLCLTAGYVSPTSFFVNGNFTAQYEKGRRVRIDNNSSVYAYATIRDSVYAGNQTTITIDDPVVQTGIVESCISIVGPESRPTDQVLNFNYLSQAVEATFIQEGDAIDLRERIEGFGGGATWDAVDIDSVTPNGFNIVSCTGVPELALQLRVYDEISLIEYGASPSLTNAENKAALDSAILFFDGKAGNITVEPSIDYGWTRLVESTWPDFSGLSSSPDTRIIIDDYSQGVTSETQAPPARSGAQHRKWYFTGNEYDGQHNGNFEYIKAKWHPGHFITNDGDRAGMAAGAGINRRASTFYGVNGNANWRVGQGRQTGDLTEDELAQFLIAVNGLSDLDIEGLTTMYVINKSDGRMGWNSGSPRFAFDFASRIGQPSAETFGFETLEGEPVLFLKGETGACRLNVKPSSGFSLNDATSFLYDVTANGAAHTLRRNNAGSVTVKLQSFSTQRNISVNDADSEFRITNAAGNSNTLRHTEAGNLTITGSYSPFTGTHLFFCPDKIEEGLAVELVDSSQIDYIEYIDQEPDYVERIEHIEAVKPPRLKGESDEEYNDRCTPAHDRVHVDVIEKDPVEKVTSLNGTVSLCNTPQSKICAGIIEHQVPMEGGYLTYVAAVGDNKTENLKGFRTTGGFEAGDILCTDVNGLLAKAPEGLPRSVVVFKAMSDPDKDGRCYGYFIG